MKKLIERFKTQGAQFTSNKTKQSLKYCLLFALSLPSLVWAALGASVSAPTGAIYPSEIKIITITLSNSNPLANITGSNFANTLPGALPNGLKIAGTATTTCAGGTVTAPLNGQSISFAGGTIPQQVGGVDGSCTISIPVTAGTSTGNSVSYNYNIASGAVKGNDGAPQQNGGAVNQSVNVNTLAKPTISKSFSPDGTLVLGGAVRTMTITLANTNPVAIAGFNITDVFPTNAGGAVMQVASPPAATATCTSGPSPAPSAVAGAFSVSATGTIPANGSCTLAVNVVARQTNGQYATTDTNIINKDTQFTNSIGIGAAADATALVTVVGSLAVSKSVNANFLSTGQPGFFDIVVTNNGLSVLPLAFTDNPIDGIGNASYGLKITSTTNSCGGTVTTNPATTGIALAGGSLAAGASCTIRINFVGTLQTPNVPLVVTNTIPAGAITTGIPGVVSQAASAATSLRDALFVTKLSPTSYVAAGSAIPYAVSIENWSAAPLSPVTFPDTFSSGLTFLTGTINGINYTPTVSGGGCSSVSTPAALNASSATFTVPSVSARTSSTAPAVCIVRFWLQVPASLPVGTVISNSLGANTVCANGAAIGTPGCYGAGVGSGGAYVEFPMQSAKSFNPVGPLQEGVTTRMRLLIYNASLNPLTNAALSDNLQLSGGGVGPGQLRVATPANASTDCVGTPVITALPGSTSITMNGATVPARPASYVYYGSCSLFVDVVGPAGSYNNTFTAVANETPTNGSPAISVNSTSNVANVVYNPALTAAKSFSPINVASGGRSRVNVRLGNLGNVPITNARVIDPLPAGMTVANPANASTTCAGSTSFTTVPGASSATMTGATIAPASTCDFLFDVVATGPTDWTNTIPAGNITADNGITSQTPVAATLVRNTQPKLTVSKSLTPSTIAGPGETSVLEIDIANTEPGAQAVSGLNLSDYYTVDGTAGAALNGMANETTPAPTTTCTGGIVSADPDGNFVALTGGTLVAGGACRIFVSVTSVQVGGITNFIPVGGISTAQGVTNVDPASSSLSTSSNVTLGKQFTPNVVKPGDSSRLRITFYNPVAQKGTNLTVTDTLPAGVVISATPNPITTCVAGIVTTPAANQVRITGAQLPPTSGSTPGSCYMEVNVTVTAAGDYINTIPIGGLSMTQGGVTVNNLYPTSDTLHARLPVVTHKAIDAKTDDLGNPVGFTTGLAARTAGSPATMTIRLDNPNSIALTQASFVDTMPAGLSVALAPNASTTCVGGTVTAVVSSQTITLSGATLPANGFCTVTVDVLSNIQGLHTNEIPAGAVSTFEGVSNATKTDATLEIVVPPTILKNFTPPLIQSGGVSVLTITIGNPNTSTATLTASMVDTLPTVPGNMVVAPAPGVSTNCSSGAASIAAPAGSGTVTFNTGGTVQAGGCTISVNVTATANGTYNNTIPAGALQTNFGNNPNPTTAPLTISSAGYISGKVFKDNNVTPDGLFNGADSPIANVVIELRDNATNALIQTTTTDALGNYTFVGLAAGAYKVVEPTQPTGTINGITTADAAGGGTATGVGVTPSVISAITLTAGGGGVISNSSNNNFAEVVTSSLSGNVFLDKNNDGIKNGADTPLAGVAIDLLNAAGTVVASTTTDAFGNYSFTGLAPGQYSISEPSQPAGTANGITTAGAVPNGGTPGVVTPTTTTPSMIGAGTKITLPPNTTSTGNNFAEIPSTRSISGRVYLDYNEDASFGVLDSGIVGQTINLIGTDVNGNPVTRTTTTLPDGTYSFANLPEGTYTVNQPNQPPSTLNGQTTAGSAGGTASNPSSTSSTIVAIDLTGSNKASVSNDFPETRLKQTVSGNVFHDANGLLGAPANTVDSTSAAAIPATLVAYIIDKNGNIFASSPVAAAGTYSFANVPAETGYYVVLRDEAGLTGAAPAPRLPATWVNTGENNSAAAGSDGLINGTSATFSVVAADVTNINFGIQQPPLVGTAVYPNQFNPGGTNTLPVGAGAFTGVLPALVAGSTNATDADGTITNITFTKFPDNVDSITINGVKYGPGFTAFPVAGVTITVAQLAGLVIDPIEGSVTPVIYYTATDNAGFVSSVGTVSLPLGAINVSGTVYNDTNGLSGSPSNTVDGTGTQATGATLTAYLVDTFTGFIVKSSDIAANGTYNFTNVANGNYTVVLSNTAGLPLGGSVAPSLPIGWANTGENVGTGAGSDGTVDGINTIIVSGNNVPFVNFGIEEPPVAGNALYPTQPNPGGNVSVPIGAGAFTGTLPAGVTGTNATDSAAVTQIIIATFPSNATSFTINGTTYTAATWPALGLTLTPTQLTLNPISVDPIAGATSVVINYTAKDAAGLVSGTGSVTLPFSQLSLSGNVFHDVNGNKLQDNPAENAATKPVPAGLNAVLTDAAGLVLAVVPVNPATGTYSFPVNPNTSYGVVLTTANPALGTSNPAVTLPSGWVTTGENLGGVIDATPDSKQNPIAVGVVDVTNVNFGVAQFASLSGIVWRDADHNRAYSVGEVLVPNITVEVLNAAGAVVATATTDASGAYTVGGLTPGVPYKVRFRDNATSGIILGVPTYDDQTANSQPGTVVTNTSGARSQIDASGAYLDVVLVAGNNLSNQSLPLDPSGAVYDSVRRTPIAGATVTLLGPGGVPVLASCLIGGINTQVTGINGIYQFLLLNPPGAGCPGTGAYTISVVQPAGYLAPNALLGGVTLPAGALTPPLGAGVLPVQAQPAQPTGADPTTYFFNINFTLTDVVGTSSQGVVNNHIPLDPITQNAFVVAKAGNKSIAEIGDTILYTVKAKFLQGLAATTFDLIDNLPAGFRYIPGTATQAAAGGVATPLADPIGSPGPQLTFKPTFAVAVTDATIIYKVRVGVGAQQGDGINRIQGKAFGGFVLSNVAQFKVKVTGGVFTNDACLAGKIFVDCNNNHIQDQEELGIPGVRFYMEDGTYLISDVEGKYSFCGISPHTHVLKADNATLPRGSRLTITSNRNAGDANSLFLDVKNGELIRADFAEGSCSNTVLEQVKARRTGGEVRAPETEKKQGPALMFEGKSPNFPQQGTDIANQVLVKPRGGGGENPVTESVNNQPVQSLPDSSGNTRGSNLRDIREGASNAK